jgi:hypothetical protein
LIIAISFQSPLFLHEVSDGRHVPDEHPHELDATHPLHRLPSVCSEELVSSLDELRMCVEELPPAIFTVPLTRLINHVEPMSTFGEQRMFDGEVPRPETLDQLRRQLWVFPVFIGPELWRNLFELLGRELFW